MRKKQQYEKSRIEEISKRTINYLENLSLELISSSKDNGENYQFLKELYSLRKKYLTFFSLDNKFDNYESDDFLRTSQELIGIYDFMGLCIPSEEDAKFMDEQEREVMRIERILSSY